jgi:alpha-mannosidase
MKNLLALACLTLAAQPLMLAREAAAGKQEDSRPTLYLVAGAHLDTQWQWTVKDTILKAIPETLRGNFALIDKYPDYVFSFEGAYRYMLAKEYYPADYQRLKGYIQAGRWHVAGGALEAGDLNIPWCESIFRQFLYGNKFFEEEFGKRSLDAFYVDGSFGFPYSLPTIAAHCGLKGFITYKLEGSTPSVPLPFPIGQWEGPDGSHMVAVLKPGSYAGKIRGDLSRAKDWIEPARWMGAACGWPAAFHLYGTGDFGGTPGEESVGWMEQSVASDGPLRVRSAGADQIFRDLPATAAARLPVYKGELQVILDGTGVLTTIGVMKRLNRENELLADAAERAAVAADWLGGQPYPSENLRQAWIRFLWHQFHDDLTGTSISDVYAVSCNDELLSLNQFAQTLGDSVGAMARGLDTGAEGQPLVVYNPLERARREAVEATIEWKGPMPQAARVFDGRGREVPSQLEGGEGNRLKILFLAEVPAVGLAAYDVRAADEPSAIKSPLHIGPEGLENGRYRIKIDSKGEISGIFDKKLNRELLKAPLGLELFKDEPPDWPSWQVNYADLAAGPVRRIDQVSRVSVLENGPVRVTLEVSRNDRGSTFTQWISLGAGDDGESIQVHNRVVWRTPDVLLKATFPLAATNPKARYDLGVGNVERGNETDHMYEVPAQRWVNLTDASGAFGVTLMSDNKYGWDKPADDILRLTLLRTPKQPSTHGWEGRYHWRRDFGTHRFGYALAGYGKAAQGEAGHSTRADHLAAAYNQPLRAFEVSAHPGPLGRAFSLVSLDSPQVAIRAMKQAENGNEIIVRLQELEGRPARGVELKFAGRVAAAREVSGAEQPVGAATVRGGRLVTDLGPYEPRTFAVRLEPPRNVIKPPACQSVPLAFDVNGVSFDGGAGQGNFDGEGRAIPGELWPTRIENDGIAFTIGPAKQANALVCRGQSIALPPHARGRIYLLAASVGGQRMATFSLDNGPSAAFRVLDWSERIGQWEMDELKGYASDKPVKLLPAFLKTEAVAWLAGHRHNAQGENDPYVFSQLFRYALDLPEGSHTLVLPNDDKIRLLAVTIASPTNDTWTRLSEWMPKLD